MGRHGRHDASQQVLVYDARRSADQDLYDYTGVVLVARRRCAIVPHPELTRLADRFLAGSLGSLDFLLEGELSQELFGMVAPSVPSRIVMRLLAHEPFVDPHDDDVDITALRITGVVDTIHVEVPNGHNDFHAPDVPVRPERVARHSDYDVVFGMLDDGPRRAANVGGAAHAAMDAVCDKDAEAKD